MKKYLEKLLAYFARKIIKKYKPKIIGITGSMGKTSAKEAVYAVLESKFNVRKNIKNYNNEIGVPLTIIGVETGGRSPIQWGIIFSKALELIFGLDKNYPEVLVLEMGADKPGDIEYLINNFPVDIGVVTKIGPTHLEAFKTVENIAKEKQKIVTYLDKDKTAILNCDDDLVREMHKKIKAKILFFGHGEESNIRSVDLAYQGDGLDLAGIKFKIAYGGSTVPVLLPGVVGAHQINSALVGASVGVALGMNLIEIADGLKNYEAPKGRMKLIKGKNTLIIDDTYNSSPRAATAAVETLAQLQIGQVLRKVAILGDMLELGDYTEEAHKKLGIKVAEKGIDVLLCVGANSQFIAEGAKSKGFAEEKIKTFSDSNILANEINSIIKDNDLILVKGSRGMHMELVVKSLMLEPEKAQELLVGF